jgi:hypothetical protein
MKDKRKREKRKNRKRKKWERWWVMKQQTRLPTLEGGKRKKNHQFWNSRIAGLVISNSLVSSPVCVCLLSML